MKELSILGGATESFVMLYDKALLQVDGAGRYDVQASLDGEHWSVLTPITAKCDHHSRTIVLDLLAGAHIRVVCVTGTMESARYSFDMGETSEAERIAAEEARVEAENKRVEAENEREVAEAAREAAEAQREKKINDLADAEATRVEKEIEREAAEAKRQATFTANEESRQSTFDTNERARQSVFNANEEKREEADALREERTDEAIATIANKVDRTDNAPELTAGFAGNLVGRGEATPEVISFRPSGGDTSIEDGTARIERLKGSTMVWNQLLAIPTTIREANGLTITIGGNKVVVNGIASKTTAISFTYLTTHIINGHKYLMLGCPSGGSSTTYYLTDQANAFDYGDGVIFNFYASSGYRDILIRCVEGTSFENVTFYPRLYDLTQMFGAGNEPTTIEEFNARKPLGMSDAYNEGELISTTADEIKSVGFNAWDEEWSVGYIKDSDGEDSDSSTTQRLKSKNKIPVLPNVSYYLGFNEGFRIYYYDVTGAYIAESSVSANRGVITTPSNAHYMRFMASQNYGAVYNHDICIHLVHTGYRNGEYEPYKEFRRSLPISEIKDSEGNALFPNGLLSAGSVYDEITATKAIKRIGVVDMGTLNWAYDSAYTSFNFYADVKKYGFAGESSDKTKPNILNSLYATSTRVGPDKDTDKTIKAYQNTALRLKDTSYTDAAALKDSLQGVMLYYELAEPIEVDLPEPINMDYEVSDFGTEEVISDTPTTPLKADIIYQFNAVDRIRENSANIKKIEEKLDDISVDLLTPITYSSLKALRDGGSLVKGMWYRITDYVTTTVQSQTKSANHPFDVIVLATSESELSHLARAIAHEGDTYFDGNDLGAWELWYDLDNDTTKYEWADEENGKGVIYRMIDEKRNDCPYDFKNILFYNDKYTSSTTSDKYYYTFSCVKNVLYDGTVEKRVTNCYGNSMGVYINSEKRSLNSNVWRNTYFDDHCYSNTFGNNCCNNTFGEACYSNTFGNNCESNTFGVNCYSNTLGGGCYYNTFGKHCYSNTFGEICTNNTFGNYCYSNTLGNYCYSNTFGESCTNNTFGNDCCYCGFYNSSEFDYNEDSDAYVGTGTPINNVSNCRFGEDCKNLLIQTSDGVKNLFVSQNLCSLTESEDGYMLPEVIEVDEYGDYELKIARNRNGEIKVYCEADLV